MEKECNANQHAAASRGPGREDHRHTGTQAERLDDVCKKEQEKPGQHTSTDQDNCAAAPGKPEREYGSDQHHRRQQERFGQEGVELELVCDRRETGFFEHPYEPGQIPQRHGIGACEAFLDFVGRQIGRELLLGDEDACAPGPGEPCLGQFPPPVQQQGAFGVDPARKFIVVGELEDDDLFQPEFVGLDPFSMNNRLTSAFIAVLTKPYALRRDSQKRGPAREISTLELFELRQQDSRKGVDDGDVDDAVVNDDTVAVVGDKDSTTKALIGCSVALVTIFDHFKENKAVYVKNIHLKP